MLKKFQIDEYNRNGYLVLNIANTKSAYNIEEGLFKIIQKMNFKYIETLKLYTDAGFKKISLKYKKKFKKIT